MKRTIAVGISVIGFVVIGGAPAAADGDHKNWGQEVKECNLTSCYGDGTSRGAYVSAQAKDGERPGYAYEIHTLANPGKSSPAGLGE